MVVRDPTTGRRIPRPTGDPTGAGYARQYEKYAGAGGDVSKIPEPTYEPEPVRVPKPTGDPTSTGYAAQYEAYKAAGGDVTGITPPITPAEVSRERLVSVRPGAVPRPSRLAPTREYVAREMFRPGVRIIPLPEKPGYVRVTPVTPPAYPKEEVIMAEPIIEVPPKKKKWWEKPEPIGKFIAEKFWKKRVGREFEIITGKPYEWKPLTRKEAAITAAAFGVGAAFPPAAAGIRLAAVKYVPRIVTPVARVVRPVLRYGLPGLYAAEVGREIAAAPKEDIPFIIGQRTREVAAFGLGARVGVRVAAPIEYRSYMEAEISKWPKSKQAEFREYWKFAKGLKTEPPIEKLSFDVKTYKGVTISKKAQDVIKSEIKRSGAILGGSVAQEAQIVTPPRRPHDIDVFIGWDKTKPTQAATELVSVLRAKGLKRFSVRGSKVYKDGAKIVEFHSRTMMQQHPYYVGTRMSPEGIKIVGLHEQIRRKLIGAYFTTRWSKDYPDFIRASRSIIISAEAETRKKLFFRRVRKEKLEEWKPFVPTIPEKVERFKITKPPKVVKPPKVRKPPKVPEYPEYKYPKPYVYPKPVKYPTYPKKVTYPEYPPTKYVPYKPPVYPPKPPVAYPPTPPPPKYPPRYPPRYPPTKYPPTVPPPVRPSVYPPSYPPTRPSVYVPPKKPPVIPPYIPTPLVKAPPRLKPIEIKTIRPVGYMPQPAAIILGITAEKVPQPAMGKYGYSPLQTRPIIVPKVKIKKKKFRRKRK